jgi:cytochrome b561
VLAPEPEQPQRYTTTAIVLHWIIALAAIGLIAFGWWMQAIPKDPVGPRVNAFNLHKSIGLTVLLLMLARLTWRTTHRPPGLPPMPAWQAAAAHANHWLLYICIILQPLSGYLGSAFSGYPVKYFGLTLPSLAAKNVALKDFFSVFHLVNSWVLVAAIVLHVAAAAKHRFIDRDEVLRRMWPRA